MSTRLRVLVGASLGFLVGIAWSRRRAFGHPQEWQVFRKNHSKFFKFVPELQSLVNTIFGDQPSANTPARRLVYLLGCLCWQDFREIVLLCGNGYGVAAAKILRSLYEHAVTAHHIAKHPENAHLFDDYIYVQDKKILEYAKTALSPDQLARLVSEDQRKRVIEEYERVRPKYSRENSWSPMNLYDMALHDGDGLHVFYAGCFVNPASHLHASPRGVYSRISQEGGKVVFQAGAQRKEASDNLQMATNLFMLSLRPQIGLFSPTLQSQLLELMPKLLSDWTSTRHGTPS
jgi:hypothetical protein